MASLKRTTGLAAAALLTLVSLAPVAEAQQPKPKQDDTVRMPAPKKADDPPTLWAYLAVFIILGAVFGANMIPSKRGHQD